MLSDYLTNTSPTRLASVLSWCVDFEFKNFKFRHPASGFLLNASLCYDTDNHTFSVSFRKCGKYPQAFEVSPSFKDFSDLLAWLCSFGV